MSVMYILSYLLKPQTQTKNQKMLKSIPVGKKGKKRKTYLLRFYFHSQEACKTLNFNDPIPQNI